MIYETIFLKDVSEVIKSNAKLTAICPKCYDDNEVNRKRPTIIVLPGGGYEFCSEGESEVVALRFIKEDFNCFVLEYSVGNIVYPTPLDEVFAAILFIKENAEKYRVDVNKICVLGFSAGGHLASSIGAFYNDQYFLDYFNVSQEKLKIAGVLLSYPVITMYDPYTHVGTRDHITQHNPELIRKFAIEKHISASYPKTFIWTTANDDIVPSINSLLIVDQLIKYQVPVEFHLYPEGPHGLSICKDGFNGVETWVDHAIRFIKEKI